LVVISYYGGRDTHGWSVHPAWFGCLGLRRWGPGSLWPTFCSNTMYIAFIRMMIASLCAMRVGSLPYLELDN
jgi:hypothetical protein